MRTVLSYGITAVSGRAMDIRVDLLDALDQVTAGEVPVRVLDACGSNRESRWTVGVRGSLLHLLESLTAGEVSARMLLRTRLLSGAGRLPRFKVSRLLPTPIHGIFYSRVTASACPRRQHHRHHGPGSWTPRRLRQRLQGGAAGRH